ncbi:MAG: TatD family hydrolase [Anaeroplasma sp.]|uniref:TatD family hydrolase n=1 Tax=Anaeroplasma sp. TaxID=1872523 RepID=UPI002A91804A|nr:TatD family hydrolase [Anaeroplasma sp.]MDY5983205.1 TatD family hydrolase [Anaeroplasma sp.]
MIDTHCHLFDEEFDIDREDAIKRAIDSGVEKMILVGFSHKTNQLAQEMAKKWNVFYPTAGLHPSEASLNYLNDFLEFKSFVEKNMVYAVGECGLDYHWDITYKEEQKKLFRLQCEYAIKKDLPIIVHSRDAAQDTYDIIASYKGKLKGVMHCYSGSKELALEYVKLGFYISLGGPVTFKNAKEPKEVAKAVPLDLLLIETDCPYLAPTPMRGKRNESSYVKYVRDEIASLRGITPKEVEEATTKNAIRLFKI